MLNNVEFEHSVGEKGNINFIKVCITKESNGYAVWIYKNEYKSSKHRFRGFFNGEQAFNNAKSLAYKICGDN